MKTENKLILGAFALLIFVSWVGSWQQSPAPQKPIPAAEGWSESQAGGNISDAEPKPVTGKFIIGEIGSPKDGFVRAGTVATLAEFKVWVEEEEMMLKVPQLILRKTGGAPWRTIEDAARNISFPAVEAGAAGTLSPDGDNRRGLAGLRLLDENSLVVSFPQEDNMALALRPGQTYCFRIRAAIGYDTDMSTLSVEMEPGTLNITGVRSKEKGSSGAMVGPTLIIRYD